MKRGLTAPFLFLALMLAAYGSARASPSLWLLSLLLLGLGGGLVPRAVRPAGMTLLGALVCVLGIWIVATNLWAHSYTAAAPFHAAFLIGGFLLGRRAGVAGAPILFAVALAFAVCMALWALWQWSALGESRAHAVFITPATLGAATNLVLLPAVTLFMLRERDRLLLPCLAILACALAVTQSRGAWIALIAAAAIMSLLVWRARIPIDRRRVVIAIAAIAGGAVAAWLIASRADVTGAIHPITGTLSAAHRFQLYELALKGIAASSWIFGSGYQGFYYLVESSRLSDPALIGSSTYFVHNDYLQALLELGVPGFAALLGIVALPVIQAWRIAGTSTLSPAERNILVALVAGTASMAVHALGDFPFYIPACVLLYGSALGILETLLLKPDCVYRLRMPQAFSNAILRRGVYAGVATLVGWVLVMPAAAEAASEYGQRQWQAGLGRKAAWGFETARRLEPRDWRYHWYAGQFWTAQAGNLADPAAAALADEAFAASISANPREVRPLHDRVALHHRLRRLLSAPARPDVLVAWAELAVALAPTDPIVRAERDSVVRQFGAAQGKAGK